MKAPWLLGLLSLLLLVAYATVAGMPGESVKRTGQPITMPAPAIRAGDGLLPVGLSDYLFLHQNRHEEIRIHAMAGATACPE